MILNRNNGIPTRTNGDNNIVKKHFYLCQQWLYYYWKWKIRTNRNESLLSFKKNFEENISKQNSDIRPNMMNRTFLNNNAAMRRRREDDDLWWSMKSGNGWAKSIINLLIKKVEIKKSWKQYYIYGYVRKLYHNDRTKNKNITLKFNEISLTMLTTTNKKIRPADQTQLTTSPDEG